MSSLPAVRCLAAALAALGSLAAAQGPNGPGRPGSWKVDTFIVLYMENRPFDHFFACMDLPGADNGAPRVLKGPKGTTVNVTCGTAPYVCDGGTGYSTWSGKFAAGCGVDSPTASCNPNIYPYSNQSDEFSVANGATAGTTAVKMFSPEQIPVKAAIAKEFGVFNKFYSAGPTASTPNHLFTQAATSCGTSKPARSSYVSSHLGEAVSDSSHTTLGLARATWHALKSLTAATRHGRTQASRTTFCGTSAAVTKQPSPR
jgi:phospholipase C|eukprot:COSAG06_NODE_1692_length_8705_cov_3.636765_10_plen_258_part_00